MHSENLYLPGRKPVMRIKAPFAGGFMIINKEDYRPGIDEEYFEPVAHVEPVVSAEPAQEVKKKFSRNS